MASKRSTVERILKEYVGEEIEEVNIYEKARKPNGYWRDFENVRLAIFEVANKIGHYPTGTELIENGYSTLPAVISKFHGGSEKIRKKINTPKFLKKTKKMLQIEEKIKEPIEVYLKREYTDNRKSTVEIAEDLDANWTSVGQWLDRFNIKRRTLSEHFLDQDVKKPSKNGLEKLYLKKRLSTIQIGEMIGVANVTVGKWLDSYDIPIRSFSESRLQKNATIPNKKELKDLYLRKKLSMKAIAKLYGITQGCIRDYCEKYGIKRRSNSEVHLPNGFKKPSKKELERMYLRDELSLKEIGKKFGVSEPTIKRISVRYGISIRNNESKYRDFNYRKNLADRLLEIRGKEPDQLTSFDFQRTKDDGKLVFAGVLNWYGDNYSCKTREALDILIKDLYGTKTEKDELEEMLIEYTGGNNGK